MKNIWANAVLTMIAFAQADANEIAYPDILSSPSKYVGRTVTMSGEFAYTEPMRGSFTFDQNGSLIEVFYGDLPEKVRALILSQREGAKTPVIVTGVLKRYTNSADTYFINASSVGLNN